MQAACDNANIGYDQYQRLSLYNFAKRVDFDPTRIKTPCETDCSALVRVCLAYAGIMVENFRTPNEASVLLRSGEFVELKEGRYTDQSTYLRRGDILVTRTQGHTVVVLSNGSKVETTPTEEPPRAILKRGMKGDDVRALQQLLIKRGYALPKYGADGEYGAETERAVKPTKVWNPTANTARSPAPRSPPSRSPSPARFESSKAPAYAPETANPTPFSNPPRRARPIPTSPHPKTAGSPSPCPTASVGSRRTPLA